MSVVCAPVETRRVWAAAVPGQVSWLLSYCYDKQHGQGSAYSRSSLTIKVGSMAAGGAHMDLSAGAECSHPEAEGHC